MVTNHATRRELLVARTSGAGVIQIPASAQSLLELRLGEWGHDAMGFVAHVPHYVAQVDYPAAAAKLLECRRGASPGWSGTSRAPARPQAPRRRDRRADRRLRGGARRSSPASSSSTTRSPVARDDDGGLPLAEERDLPTAEELGAEFERFLAGLDPATGRPGRTTAMPASADELAGRCSTSRPST